jgi:ArsR family metal-binding transcriptional regulator
MASFIYKYAIYSTHRRIIVMKKAYQITEDGKVTLEKELDELKGRRGDIAEKIAAARDFGDLSENAE